MAGIDFQSDLGKRALDRLEREQVVWLTPTSPNGTPLPIPVWFLWHKGKVLIYSQPDTAKLRAIRHNDRVALNFNSDEHGGNIVILKGVAELVGDGLPATSLPPYLTKYADGITSLDMTPESFASDYSQLIRVTPDRLNGF